MLRWFRDDTNVRLLARDARIGISTAYRHPHEGIDVLAAQAPDLHAVLGRARREGWSHISLVGTDRVKGRHLAPDTATRNQLINALRAPGERGNAILKTRWTALQRIRLCPWRIGDIAAATLVLSTLERGRY